MAEPIITNTIFAQLGGRQFAAMTGARDIVRDEEAKTLRMKIGANLLRATHFAVRLDASDTYTLLFYRLRGVNFPLIAEQSGVYADQLQAVFANMTGLRTKL